MVPTGRALRSLLRDFIASKAGDLQSLHEAVAVATRLRSHAVRIACSVHRSSRGRQRLPASLLGWNA
jgi:hypothetical protein